MKLVVDTNVLISALVKNGFTRNFLINRSILFELITPAYVFSEIEKYKSYICEKSEITEKQFYILLEKLMKYIVVINPIHYSSFLKQADDVIGHIHKSDVVFIATALAFNCPVWSDDKHFKMQKEVKVLTNYDIDKILR